MLWSHYRFKRKEEQYLKYQKYEDNPKLAVKETRKIIKRLGQNKGDEFTLFNRRIPPYACSVLMRDFPDQLSDEDKDFCKSIIVDFALIPLNIEGYRYQISDGVEPSIEVLPEVIRHFPDEKTDVNALLLTLLLNPWREIHVFAARAVLHSLWGLDFNSANSITMGYLFLKPQYDAIGIAIREENFEKQIFNYLLAWPYWKKDAKEWHTLKDREKLFFKKVAEDIGDHPSVLYSIAKVLNDIGSHFTDDGIDWLSGIIQSNPELTSEKLEVNTIYYIETLIRRYVLTNRHKIRTTLQLKNKVIAILTFLVERGSVTGYMLREDVL